MACVGLAVLTPPERSAADVPDQTIQAKGFDICQAPSETVMDSWWTSSVTPASPPSRQRLTATMCGPWNRATRPSTLQATWGNPGPLRRPRGCQPEPCGWHVLMPRLGLQWLSPGIAHPSKRIAPPRLCFITAMTAGRHGQRYSRNAPSVDTVAYDLRRVRTHYQSGAARERRCPTTSGMRISRLVGRTAGVGTAILRPGVIAISVLTIGHYWGGRPAPVQDLAVASHGRYHGRRGSGDQLPSSRFHKCFRSQLHSFRLPKGVFCHG